MTVALEGIRILDMAPMGPGPFCSTILGDLGADVVKVHEACPERRGGPTSIVLAELPNFPGWRNCRAIGINLKVKRGHEVFYRLAETADVVVDGYRPGVAARLGVDYETLREVNPRIVYASLTGFGQTGPYRDVAGHDINYIALGGLLGMTGLPDGPPVIPGTLIGDFAAGGMSGAIGILAALMARERTGTGQCVDVSATDGVVGLMITQIEPYLAGGVVRERGRTMATGEWPWYNVYRTRDGKHIAVGAVEPWFYANLCELLGREDLIEHQYTEGEKREQTFRDFRELFSTKTRDEWVEIMRQKDTCVSPVYSPDEVGSDPHLLHRGVITDVDHPVMGRVRQVGPMMKLSESPFEVRQWSMRFGQHTEELLLEAGYDKAAIDELRAAEVIG